MIPQVVASGNHDSSHESLFILLLTHKTAAAAVGHIQNFISLATDKDVKLLELRLDNNQK